MAHHRQLFGDLYAWAGKLRTVSIAKGAYRFEPPDRIGTELDRVLGNLFREKVLKNLAIDAFCERASSALFRLKRRPPISRRQWSCFATFLRAVGAKGGLSPGLGHGATGNVD